MTEQTGKREQEEDLSRREKDFLTYFGYLDARLINHFSCACQSATDIILYHGRMFITERYICFSSHIIKEYLKVIPFSDITNIVKKNTALVFSNAIGVTHKKGSEFFTSFLHRDKVFDLLHTLWRKNKGEESLGINIRSLIKQEQQAAKPQPDNSTPETHKKPTPNQNSVLESQELPKATSPRESIPEVLQSAPSIIQTTGAPKPPTTPPEESEIKPEQEQILAKRRTSQQHPLDLTLLRSGKPKKKIVKRDSTIPEEILQEIENEQKKETPEDPVTEIVEEKASVHDYLAGVLFPSHGKYTEHITIDNEPCIDRIYANIIPKEFYARLLYSPEFWEHVFVVTDSTDINIPLFQAPGEECVHLERICKFVAPIKGAPMGPKQTRVRQTHRVSLPDENHVVFDTSNVSLDIPMYSDAFVVESRWDVTKEGTGCRLQIRWKVKFLKSVWVKGMIEKNAKVATEEFYRVWAEEAQKELTKKKEPSEPVSERKLVATDHDLPVIKHPVVFEKESTTNSSTGMQFTVPLVGIQVSLTMIAMFAFFMLLICSGTYFYLRISYIHSDIREWKETHRELEDRLVFLQSVAARLAMNFTENGNIGKQNVWGDWKEKNSDLDWRLSEWQEEIQHLQHTLSSTLVNVGEVLEYSSGKKLGLSSKPLLLSLTRSTDTKVRIAENVEKQESNFAWNTLTLGFISLLAASSGVIFLLK